MFDPGGLLIHVGRDIVDVKLQGVSASLFNLESIVGPAAQRTPVETRDNRNVDSRLRPRDVLGVGCRPRFELRRFGKIGQ